MSYNVYQVAFSGMPRDHLTIFVETEERGQGTGFIYQVAGDIQNGMAHKHKETKRPEDSLTFVPGGKKFIGKVSHANYSRIRTICDAIPPPKKQFNGPKRLFPKEPLRRCQEWTNEAVQALTAAGVLVA